MDLRYCMYLNQFFKEPLTRLCWQSPFPIEVTKTRPQPQKSTTGFDVTTLFMRAEKHRGLWLQVL